MHEHVPQVSFSSHLMRLPPRLLTEAAICNRYVEDTIGRAAPLEAFYIDPRPRTAYRKWVHLHCALWKGSTCALLARKGSEQPCATRLNSGYSARKAHSASSNMFGVLSLQLMGITQRINTVNGRKYSEDPTIFAWELCNECQSVPVAPCSALVATAHPTICV